VRIDAPDVVIGPGPQTRRPPPELFRGSSAEGSLGVHHNEQTDRVRRDLKAELKRADVSYNPAEALPWLGGDGDTVEVDGGYFGGYIKPANHRENRRDRRLAKNQNEAAPFRWSV